MVTLLLKYKANPNIVATDGTTPLWWAKDHHNSELIHLLEHPEQARQSLRYQKDLEDFSEMTINPERKREEEQEDAARICSEMSEDLKVIETNPNYN